MSNKNTTCQACGMLTNGHADFHPYAACLMFKACKNGKTVEANLRAVVEYGMNCQKRGISLETAMHNIAACRARR